MSVAPGCDPLDNVAKTCLVGYSPWQKNPCAISKTILPALAVAVKPDAPLLAQQDPVYRMGESGKGGKLDAGQ